MSEKERVVFETLASFGASPVSQIAKDTSLNRTALYHTIKLLEARGLVSEIKKNDTTLFQAISEDEFVTWSKNQIKSLEDNATKLIQSFKKKNHPVLHSGIRYFEGKEAVKKLYGETWRENNDKHILAITDYQKAYETMGEFFDEDYFPYRVKTGVSVESLLPMDKYGKRDKMREKELLRKMRFSDVFKDLGIEINIFDDKLAIVAFDKKEPMGMILKNKIISDAFRKIFAHLWQNSRK
jgi:sugar-specific transcriptional regulator TrmB